MFRKSLYLSLFASILLFSCSSDWFDVKSNKALSVPTTLKDLQALLDNAALFNTFGPYLSEVSSDGFFYSEEVANALPGYERNAYTWSHELPNRSVTDWANGSASGSYGRVYVANLVLETLEKYSLKDHEKESFNNIKGQALFLRAKTFFELATTFSPFYDEGSSKKSFGIPLRLESDVSLKSSRSTVEETYQQIINDLKSSVSLLPITQPFLTRASRVAATAMLARVFLSIEKYDDALQFSNLSLKDRGELIDYLELDSNTTDNPFVGFNKEILFYSYMNGIYFSPSFVCVNIEIFNSYNVNDLRKRLYYNFDSIANVVTFKGTYSGRGFNNFFNGLAIDEIYLIRAECYARKGKVSEAMDDLNSLLKARWNGDFINLTAANSKMALDLILSERKKELMFRGVRWSDLRRLNRDPSYVQTFTRSTGGKVYQLEPNSYKYTFPVPDDIIEITGMQQNPGW